MTHTTITLPQTFIQSPPAKDFCGIVDTPLLRFGSGAYLAHSYLRAGFGGLAHSPSQTNAHAGNNMPKPAVALTTSSPWMAEAARTRKGGAGNADPYWQDAMKELLSHSIDALIAAYGTLRLHDIQRFVESIPIPNRCN
jgi:hypothetical protein